MLTLTTVLRRERSANGQITAMQLRLSSKNAIMRNELRKQRCYVQP